MDPERFRQVERLYHSVLEREESQRSAFLDEACAGDPSLRREVESLLGHNVAASPVDSPAIEAAARVLAQDESHRRRSGQMAEQQRAGTTVSHYRVLEKLGGGGMGVVYRAQDTRLGRYVALKFLPAHLAQNHAALERFQREARAASALNHPNICTVHDIGEFEEQPFIVMELLQGETLAHRISRKPVPTDLALNLSIQITEALEAAHAKGIIHRDLKPANIFITQRDQVKVLDFGLAKLAEPASGELVSTATRLEPQTEEGAILGTVAYMSPEQARGEELDARTDLFSFGSVLYEMATGKPAFTGSTKAVIFSATLERTPVPALHLNPELPPKFGEIIDKALEKSRDMRYQTASDLSADLKRLKRDSAPAPLASVAPVEEFSAPAATRPVPTAGRVGLRANIRRWSVLLVAALLLLVGLIVVTRFWQSAKQVARGTQKRLTANPDEDPVRTAVISPDGAYLAYSDPTGAYLKQVATGETHPVTLPKGVGGHPVAWYPDGNHFVLQMFTGPEEKPSLWSLSMLGGNPRKLVDDGWGAAISPDGSRITFIRGAVGVSGYCRLDLDCRYALGSEIWTMGPDGAEPQKIVDANAEDLFGPAAWSPDGQRIAYVKLHANAAISQFSIETRDLLTGKAAVVQTEPRFNRDAELLNWQPVVCWTRDGRVIFARHELHPNEDDSNAWAVRVDPRTGLPSGKPIRLTSGSGAISSFSITADTKQLSFIKTTLQPQVYVGELDTTARALKNNRRLTLDQAGSWPTAWTADSRSVLFFSNRIGRMEIFKQQIDQPTAELLASDPTREEVVPRLSPDGSEAFFVSYPVEESPSGIPRLMRVPTAGGPPRLVLEAPDIDNINCAKAPATTCVFGRGDSAGNETIFAFDPALGTSREILKISEPRFSNWGLAKDGSLLAFFVPDPHEGRVRLFFLRDSTTRDLLVKNWTGLSTLDWASDSRSFFATSLRPDGTIVMLNVDLQGNARPVLTQKNGQMCWAIPSPDGRRLATMLMNGESNAWLLEGF